MISLLVACSKNGTKLDNIPIVVSQPDAHAVDINIVIDNAHQEVEKILPGANLTFLSLVAECKSLSELQGEINLFFSQTRLTFFGERVFTARVTINTTQQKMRMEIQDETEQYLSTELLELTGISTLEIANALETYLDAAGECNDTVVLARAATIGPWGVRCGAPDKVFIECIVIDPVIGDIIKVR